MTVSKTAAVSILFAFTGLRTPSAQATASVSSPPSPASIANATQTTAAPDSPEEPDDNPYDAPEPSLRAPAPRAPRVAIEVRDGMVHVPSGTFTMVTSSTRAPS